MLDTDSLLALHNLKILTGNPQSIQGNGRVPPVPPPPPDRSMTNINPPGSMRSRGSQADVPERRKTPKKSLPRRFLTFFKGIVYPEPPAESSSSGDEEIELTKFERKHDKYERDTEWLNPPREESNRDDMQAAYERKLRKTPP